MDNATLIFKRLRNYAATKPTRDEEYLKRIRILPCCVCGKESEPHHIFQSYGPLKTGDHYTIPVCREHHDHFHRNAHLAEIQGQMIEQLIKTLEKAI